MAAIGTRAGFDDIIHIPTVGYRAAVPQIIGYRLRPLPSIVGVGRDMPKRRSFGFEHPLRVISKAGGEALNVDTALQKATIGSIGITLRSIGFPRCTEGFGQQIPKGIISHGLVQPVGVVPLQAHFFQQIVVIFYIFGDAAVALSVPGFGAALACQAPNVVGLVRCIGLVVVGIGLFGGAISCCT